MKKSYEINMCEGPILGKVLIFSIPLMLSGILQLLFNAADVIVMSVGEKDHGQIKVFFFKPLGNQVSVAAWIDYGTVAGGFVVDQIAIGL